MNTELQQERMSREVELPDACVLCDGTIVAKLTAGSARAVCLACRLVTTLELARAGDGIQMSHLPGAIA